MLLKSQKKGDKDITSKSINILLIEDNEGDVRLIREMLKEAKNLAFKVEASGLLNKAIKILKSHKFDAILLDLNLPDSIGIETAFKTLEVIRDIPIIILTGLNEESLAISTVKMGVQDYLVKEQLNSILLVRSIQYAIERKKTEQKLKESEEKYKLLYQNAPLGYQSLDYNGNFIDVNKAWLEFFGYSRDEVVGKWFGDFVDPSFLKVFQTKFSKFRKEGKVRRVEYDMIKKDKTHAIVIFNGNVSYDLDGSLKQTHCIFQDITERKKAEQKLEESEANYRLITENANDLIAVLDDKFRLEYINETPLNKMLGYNSVDYIGKSDFLVVHPDDRKMVLNRLIKSSEVGVGIIDARLKHKDGHYVWVESRGKTFFDRNGEKKILINIRNITERKKAEMKIIESERKYRNLIETAVMGIIEFDVEENTVSYINPKLLEILGYTKEDLLVEKNFLKIAHPEDQKELIKSSEDKYVEFRIFSKDGKLKWLSGTRNNRFNKEGKMISARLWLQDSTESKEVEEIKNNLLTRFSHEFKTPLISIKGFADFLLTTHNKYLDDKTISFLKKIKDGGDRLKELVNTFIESSQLDQALTKLKLHQENLSDLIKTGLEEMQGLINLRDHTINLDIHDQLIASVDKEKIYSVVTNLLLNAINYTPKGGKIWIQSIINEGSVIVSVKDNGIGLDDIEKNQLFKPFGKIERYGKGWDIISEGMGMGLYLSKEIMNLHGGKIWVESKGISKGTTFYFSLPIVTN